MTREDTLARRPRHAVVAALACALALAAAPALAPAPALADEPEPAATDAAPAAVTDETWSATVTGVRNTTTVTLEVPGAAELVAEGAADTARVHATMSYAGQVTRDVTCDVALSELAGGPATVDLGDFGRFSVTVSFLKDGEEVRANPAETVGVTADTYNIAPVSATLPTTFFSLNLWGEGSMRADGPVILLMERPDAYNWDALPAAGDGMYGAYGLPYLTRDDIAYQDPDFDQASYLFRERTDAMAAYVRDLMELDPTSHVNLYCVDFYVGLVQRIIYANRIPEGNYTLTIMSDGSWSYAHLADVYAGADNEATHAALVADWNAAKAYAYEHGAVREDYLDWSHANRCLWAAVDAEGSAQWWVARKDLLATEADGNAFGQAVQASEKVVQVNIASLLTNNIQPSERATEEFKALYNFNDSYFSAAEEQGKDVMLFLGTRVTGEVGFADYARFAMSYYGDDYLYYYKGHPGTPTELNPDKQAQLDRLGVTDIDSSVAAELILFFNPEIYLSGYGSSTYASVPEGMAKGMFEMTREQGLADPLYADMDYWSSRVTAESPEAVRALCQDGHNCYLVEFSDAIRAREGYDVAVWDASAALITYYDQRGDAYVKVGEQEGVGDGFAVPQGTYVIQSAVAGDRVVDVAGGSRDDGANVWSYADNGTDAQRWEIVYDDAGLATITNVGTGGALDIQYAAAVSGANVWQYAPSGTLSQKWRISDAGDGTFRIASALDEGIVLDVAGGSTQSGANLQVYADNGSLAQRFRFYAVDAGVSAEGQADVEDGTYVISTSLDAGKALDVRDWSTQKAAAIQLWDYAATPNQQFEIERLESGFYRVTNVHSGLALQVAHGSVLPGMGIEQRGAEGETPAAQQWAIRAREDGTYELQNVASGLMLDVLGGSAANGQAVIGFGDNGTAAQGWVIEPVA
ncbi:RICIN domain-containing protein [Thermophilibacter mediterraneus]|uniref:RICIN domain-containing protein n=1 Tax=Thermophilibacter mediterraneus TaxID=1871031 RepID=UPI00235746DF|nr:RICIN domain-containing protein [Thermophilibacter mediterraneus]